MKRLIISILFLPLLIISCRESPCRKGGDTRDLRIDGIFKDWGGIVASPSVRKNGGASMIRRIRFFDSPDRLFLFLDLNDEISLQNGNSLAIYLDTDNDQSTGTQIAGIGADLSWRFGEREGLLYTVPDSLPVNAYDIGLVSAPTVTSDRFEVELEKNPALTGSRTLFPVSRIGWAVTDGTDDGVLTGSYRLKGSRLPVYSPVSIGRPDSPHIRIVTYNVLWDGLFSRPEPFGRILRALDPDIINFQEIGTHGEDDVRRLVTEMLGGEWYSSSRRDVVTLSRYQVIQTGSSDGNLAVLINLPDQHYKKDIFLINAHLPFGPHHRAREKEISGLMELIDEVKAGKGEMTVPPLTPLVIVGDMNLVGPASDLEFLLAGEGSGPDWDGTPLTDLHPYHNAASRSYTWQRTRRTGFGPGRLDYIIYSDSVLTPLKSFILATESMTAAALHKAGLEESDSIEASDHYPLVVDFEI